MELRYWKFKAAALSILLVVLGYLYIDNSGIFPERTQMKLARTASGLNLKNGCKIVYFFEDIPVTSDGLIMIEIKFDKNELDEILLDARSKGYKKITKENLIKDKIIDSSGDATIFLHKKSVSSIKNGVYYLDAVSLKKNDFEYTISSVNIDSMEIVIFGMYH